MMVLVINKSRIFALLFVCVSLFSSCKKTAKDWNAIAESIDKWKVYQLSNNVLAPFPGKPISKKIALDSYNAIVLDENNCTRDSITYSVNFISNSTLKDKASWDNFLKNEVMAFKALEQKKIKLGNYEAILSKVRENDLCALTLNCIVDSKYIINIAIRYKGEMPDEKIMNSFIKRIVF